MSRHLRAPDRAPAPRDAPWATPAAEVVAALGADPAAGLDGVSAADHLREHGPNDLPHKFPRGLVASIAGQLRETMILVLIGAAVLTAVTGDLADCAVILLVIVVNTRSACCRSAARWTRSRRCAR